CGSRFEGTGGRGKRSMSQCRRQMFGRKKMNLDQLFVSVPAALIMLGIGAASAGSTINKVGALACVTDKWNASESEKGHKLVDFAGRCINIPDDPTATPMATEDCLGKYEYMPDVTFGFNMVPFSRHAV